MYVHASPKVLGNEPRASMFANVRGAALNVKGLDVNLSTYDFLFQMR